MEREKWNLGKLRISGGEPLEHPQFLRIMSAVRRMAKRSKSTHVSTNGLKKRPLLPDGIRYNIVRACDKQHEPFMVSPEDIGIRPTKEYCKLPIFCGACYDVWGWSFCPVGSVLGVALGVPSHSPNPVPQEMNADICKHCIYSLPNGPRNAIYKAVATGDIKCPTQTFKNAIERNRNANGN